MRSSPKISIVTPSFNSVNTIRETIESVSNQDYSNWEHIIVDGGSTDGTLDIFKEYPHLQWSSEKDKGHYHAMNKGISRITGDLVVILNADDCFRKEALSAVIKSFAKNPNWDGLFGDVIFVDGAGKEIYRREEAVYDYNVLRFGIDYICHHTLFVRKEVYDRLGGYRYEEFLNSADFEFKIRLGKFKCRIGHVRQFLVDYRYHDFGQSADVRITQNMEKESQRIRREYGTPAGWIGKCLKILFKAKRQLQKLLIRGKCDLIPGTWHLKSHMKERTSFSSNSGLDKL